jgi:nucleotide-binding universal stress UspA family protein
MDAPRPNETDARGPKETDASRPTEIDARRPKETAAPHPDSEPLRAEDDVAVSTTAVVVGIDGSETSWDAFWWACGEARRLGGRLVAVFVSPNPMADASVVAACTAFTGVSVAHLATDNRESCRADQLRERLKRCAADGDLPVTFVHACGDATNELLRVAQAHHADLIVIGKSTKARHHVAGSLGRRLIGKRDAPVVVVVP